MRLSGRLSPEDQGWNSEGRYMEVCALNIFARPRVAVAVECIAFKNCEIDILLMHKFRVVISAKQNFRKSLSSEGGLSDF